MDGWDVVKAVGRGARWPFVATYTLYDNKRRFYVRQWVGIAAVLLAIVTVAGGIAWAAMRATEASCHNKWAPTPTEFHMFGGCRVQYRGRWIPESQVNQRWLDVEIATR